MGRINSNRSGNRSVTKSIFFGLCSFGVHIYDLLAICHLVPVHTIYLIKPLAPVWVNRKQQGGKRSAVSTKDD